MLTSYQTIGLVVTALTALPLSGLVVYAIVSGVVRSIKKPDAYKIVNWKEE